MSSPAIALCDGAAGGLGLLWTSPAFAAADFPATPATLRAMAAAGKPFSIEAGTEGGSRVDGFPLPPDAPMVWLLRLSAPDAPRLDEAFVHDLATVIVLYDAEDRLLWHNRAYERVLGANAHLLRIGEPFAEIMAAAYRAGHAATQGEDIETLIARRLARHRARETFEEVLGDGRRLKTEEIATATGMLGVRTEIT